MSKPTCRGCYALGTACGACSRCHDERERLQIPLQVEELLYRLAPNQGIIGIDRTLKIFDGYDGRLDEADIYPLDEARQLNTEEKLLLADEMIHRWAAYRSAVTASSEARK